MRSGYESWLFYIHYRFRHSFPSKLLQHPLPKVKFGSFNFSVPRGGIEIMKHLYPLIGGSWSSQRAVKSSDKIRSNIALKISEPAKTLVSVEVCPGLPTLLGQLVSSYVVPVKSRTFSFIPVFLLAPEGLFLNRKNKFAFYDFVKVSILHQNVQP